MPTDTIQLQITKNGGAPATGAVVAAFSDSIVLGLGSTASGIKKVKYRIYEFPDGFPCPAGWTQEAANCYSLTLPNGADTPPFTLPAGGDELRGKYFFDAVGNDQKVNGSIVGDLRSKAQIKIPFLNAGLEDVGFKETNEFDGDRQAVSAIKNLIRVVDAGVVVTGTGGLPAPALVATSNVAITGVVTIDGTLTSSLAAGAVVLLTAQTNPVENGYWIKNDAGAWTRPSYYNSDALVAATLGQLSGAALGGTLNKGKSFYALSGATLAGAKVWLPGKAPPVIHANEAPWNLTGSSADDTVMLAALFAYAAVNGAGVKVAFGPGLYKTTAPIVLGRYISIEGAGKGATEIRYTGAVLGDTFKLSEQLNIGGGHHGKISHIKISNAFIGYQPPARTNLTPIALGAIYRCALPGVQLLKCITAGTTGAHPPIGELCAHGATGMLLTGTANASKTPVVVIRTGGYLGTMSYHLSTDNGATIDAVHTTSLLNADGTYRDFETATFPSSGTLGVKMMSRSAIAAGVYGATTLAASFVQPNVGSNRQIQITGLDTNGSDIINTTRLLSSGWCFINGGGLYSLVSIDTALLVTVKLVTAIAAPGATVAVSWVGQACYPQPRVEVLGAPAADNWAFETYPNVDGALGTATFKFSSRALAAIDRGKPQAMVIETPTITTTAGAYSDYSDAISGCTIRFHTGVYQSNTGWLYTTPGSVSSMVVGSTITDGTVVWEVMEGPEPIRANGRGFLTLDDVWLEGGMTGIWMSQSEGVTIHDTIFNGQLACGGYGSSGEMRLGEYGGFTNNIVFSGTCFWYTLGYGIVYDGGNCLIVEGTCGFQSTPSGGMLLTYTAGGKASGFYLESSGPIQVRNCLAFTRRPVAFGLNGFEFAGFFTGASGGDCSFDMWYSEGVSWVGGQFGGTSYGIKNAIYVANGHSEGCQHINSLPIADNTFGTGRQMARGVETNCLLQVDYPNAQTLANGVNDLAAPVISNVDLSGPTGAFSIRSAPVGVHGQRVTYRYFGTQTLTLKHQDATPAAATRLICSTGADIVLTPPAGGFLEFTLAYRAGSINRHVVTVGS